MSRGTRFLAALTACAWCFCPPARGQVNVVTYHNDAARTGQNIQETLLTPANVNPVQFGKLFAQNVDGLVVAQPLYLQNVSIPGAGTHNVVYVVTMHDTLYAFDADSNQGSSAAPLWTVNFTNPAAGITTVPIADLSCTQTTGFTEMGIEGTPVIDLNNGTLYLTVKTKENGTFVNRIHAVDVTNGAEKLGGPVVITGSVTASNGTIVPFIPQKQMTRPALLLSDGVLYVSMGTLGCNGGGVHGWVMAYDAVSLAQLGVFNATPNVAGGAGLWQAGGGPAADSNDNVYFQTADGFFDQNTGGGDYGDTLIKLALDQDALAVEDYFTPYNQANLKAMDQDLGSGGVLVLPDQPGIHPHLLVGGGKAGTVYLLDRDDLGGYCNGCTGDTQPEILQSIPGFGSMRSTPAYWNNTVYVAGGSGVGAFLLDQDELTLTSQTSKMGGATSPTITANGASNGILWVMNYNVLFAFDATNLTKMLYSSAMAAGSRDAIGTTAHFAVPVIANGKAYVATTSQLLVFGLFAGLSAASGNNQSAAAKTTLPLPLQVQAKDPYAGTPFPGVTVTFSDGGKGGVFGSPTAVTDANGNASTTYTLPPRALSLPYTITASSTGLASALFRETVVPGPPKKLGVVSGINQSAPVSTTLPAPLVVSVLDAYGNTEPGVQVSFSDGGAGGSLSPTTATTNSQGRASVTYTTPVQAGAVTITASSAGTNSVKFPETVTSQ